MKFKFNYKFIKENSKPGSWRRGYEYHLKGQVNDISYDNDSKVIGKVKGNFKDFYTTTIEFDKKGAKATCTCPLNEEWCKHSVAVGLKAIENHYWDEYLYEKFDIPPVFDDINLPFYDSPQGGYVFHFNPKRRQNFFSVLVMDRKNNRVIRDLEALLKAAIALQKSDPDFVFTPAQKVEISIFQNLLKLSRLDKKSGWYDIQISKFDPFFQLLAMAEDVVDAKTHKKLKFSPKPWNLCLAVNFSYVGNVMCSLYWFSPEKEDILPFEEVHYFSRQLKWGRHNDVIFPTDVAISSLPQNLAKASFTDIKDAEGGKFIYEELPKLRSIMNVELSEEMRKLTLEPQPPKCHVALSVDYDMSLKAALEFEYDGTRVPYTKNIKSPYVTIKKPKEDLLYWVKRNANYEEQAYQMLLACKFAPMQTNNLALNKESAIDFYNFYMNKAGEGWVFEEKDDLSYYKLSSKPFELCADIDFSLDSTDSFEIELYGKVDKEKIEFEQIQSIIYDGSKYIHLKGIGQALIPSENIFALMKSFNTFDVYKNEENKYIVKTYRAGVISEMNTLGLNLKMSRRYSKFWKQISTFSEMDNVALPKSTIGELREYQKKGFSWLWFLYQYGLNGILADDMGLGKTLQTLTLLQKAKEKNNAMPSLVICPTSVVFNWEAEIEKFSPNLKCLKISGANRKEQFEKIEKHDVIITSYALVRRDIEKLKKINFRYIILDESQNIKNADSLTSKSVKSLQGQHRLALSGTPIENKLEELHSIFDFLMPGFLLDSGEFNRRYVNPIMEREDKIVERRLKLQIYPFILRRMKRDVAKDLPEKTENVAYCELTPDQKELYLQVLDATKQEIFNSINTVGLEKSRMSIFSALLRLRQICNHPRLYDKEGQLGINESGKFQELQSMLEEIISENHRILLFSQFVGMLDIIKSWLETKGIKHEYLSGKTKDRQAVVEKFNNDPTIPIFLISLKAGGTGLNLTGADYVIHYDPWWNPAVEDQATDRAYRIGQTKKVFVYRLITKGTVEEKIQRLKSKKRSLVDSVISVDRNIGKSLTYEDLKDIFSMD